MADQESGSPEKSAQAQLEPGTSDEGAASGSEGKDGVAEGLRKQRISGILRGVLQETPPANADGRVRRYPWYVDAALGVGILVATAGFAMGLFKMYLLHAAKQCMEEANYPAAIALLKGNPLPRLVNLAGGRDEDPDELLARALYLDAMRKMDGNDITGGLADLQQIRSGTAQFDAAQKIMVDNFTPSSTKLTGGVVLNDETIPQH